MKERPILFSGEMVRAILGGRKTQTRRPVKGKWVELVDEVIRINGKWVFTTLEYDLTTPYGQPGDRLWVRETFHYADLGEALRSGCPDYKADQFHIESDDFMGWRPSIHMPRWASRIILEIVNVTVERLNNISVEDSLAEGITHSTLNDPRMEYAQLWNAHYGPSSWEKNPWVWVIEYKRVNP